MPPAMMPLPGAKNIMMGFEQGGKYLYLTVDASQNLGPSSTGKTTTVASTCGNRQIGQTNVFIGFNAFAKGDKPFDESDLDCMVTDAGKNLQWSREGSNVTLKIDLTTEGEQKEGSKNRMLATTSGNKKLGTTGIMFGLNVYHKIEDAVNLAGIPDSSSVVNGPWHCHGMVVTLGEEGKKAVAQIKLDGDLKESKSGRAKIVATTGGGGVPLGTSGFTLALTLSTKEGEADTDGAPAGWEPVVNKGDPKGVRWRKTPEGIVVEHDLTGDYGESSSGMTRQIASTSGVCRLKGTNLNLGSNVWKKIPGAKRKAEPEKAEKGKKGKRWTAKQVSKAVVEYLEAREGDEEGVPMRQLRADLCSKYGWEDSDALKAAVKKGVEQYNKGSDDEGEESGAGSE
eukprot:TRINITY_DN1593_c5_g1_i1.p1 TRINITY_DN1593_c5_g1~~TRINITY_DN1593_c5_g1_i1.p1  ORF type:complete len:424 (+),score=184.65 TRINITY_DN1593_c5_g1_i1:82-1272(+)